MAFAGIWWECMGYGCDWPCLHRVSSGCGNGLTIHPGRPRLAVRLTQVLGRKDFALAALLWKTDYEQIAFLNCQVCDE